MIPNLRHSNQLDFFPILLPELYLVFTIYTTHSSNLARTRHGTDFNQIYPTGKVQSTTKFQATSHYSLITNKILKSTLVCTIG